MAYIINIEISQFTESYKENFSTFKNHYLTNTYYDDYLKMYTLKSEEHFQEIIDDFLEKYQWAVFSYFTTFHSKHIIFVSNDKEVYERYLICIGHIEENFYTKIRDFRTISFDDTGDEGEAIFKLSQELDKRNPYLICYFDRRMKYYRYDYETTEFEDFIWYEDDIRALKEIKRFFDKYGEYIIYEVTDEYAFLKIWEMASDDLNIAQFVVSHDSNLNEVEKILKENYDYLEKLKEEPSLSWAYSQVYGGGSDEHHGIFYAKDAKHTDKIASYLDKGAWFSRY